MSDSLEELLHHEINLCDPTIEEMEELAEENKDRIIYDPPFLLSKDRKILYGFCIEELKERDAWKLLIPEEVEVFDNICYHSQDDAYDFWVEIGKNLREIKNKDGCFGLFVSSYYVEEENKNFCDIDGMLYSKDQKNLILYPSGRTSQFEEINVDREEAFIVIPPGTKKITDGAFYMMLLPLILVIPDSVEEIEFGAFFEDFDKGYWMTARQVDARSIILPRRFENVIDGRWEENAYDRPNVMYY